MTRVGSWLGISSSREGKCNGPSLSREILAALSPPARQNPSTGRFSQLLLEHGESVLQDWAVVASSTLGAKEKSQVEPFALSHDQDAKIRWEQQKQTSQRGHWTPAPTVSKAASLAASETYGFINMSGIGGRLRLCSRSIVFEPDDMTRPIVRIPLAHLQMHPSLADQAPNTAQFTSQRHFIMKANNAVAPFIPVKQPCVFKLVFQHSSAATFNRLVERIASDNANPDKEPSSAMKSAGALFYPENLVDMREAIILTNIRAWIKTPLLSQDVVLAVTAERIYLQPHQGIQLADTADGIVQSPSPAQNWMLRDIIATARRYNGLRDSAIQIYLRSGYSILIALERRHERELVLRALPDVICFTDRSFVELVVAEWQKGTITNNQYLLALNSAAGRTFLDLGRYPVFPWVIQEYGRSTTKLDLQSAASFRDLSKPMGALNPERLEYFKQRMTNMHDMGTEFLYGTHYSAPGYVLYYMVRSMPEHMLCLQNGKFDAADRLFFDIEHTYKCALSNHADVKELIPEFFGTDIDFLINARGLHLGATQNGQRVDDVHLPAWAKSAKDFLKKNRMALESETCTKMLPRWIDLIFGYKSRGEAAAEADNLFHPISYFGPSDLAAMQSENDRQSAELQAIEFGCCPDQLFIKAHPQRNDRTTEWDFISSDIGRASSKDDEKGRETWELLDVPTADSPSSDGPSVGVPLNIHTGAENGRVKNGDGGTVGLKAGVSTATVPFPGKGELDVQLESGSQGTSHDVVAEPPADMPHTSSSFDQIPETSSTDWTMQTIERKELHGDAISGCLMALDPSGSVLLVTTSLDGGLKVQRLSLEATNNDDDAERKGFPTTLGRFSYSAILSRNHPKLTLSSKLTEYRAHSSRDPLASLALASDGSSGIIAFAGGHDDVVLAYGINSSCAVASVYSHRDAVTGLDLICRTSADFENALWLENSTHIMVSGSWDAAIKVWSVCISKSEAVSISREPLAELFDAESSIVCVSAVRVPDSVGGIIIAAGCVDSSFRVWRVHNDGMQVAIHFEPARHGLGPCSVVKWIFVNGALHLLVAFSSGKIASYSIGGERLKRDSAVSVGVAISAMEFCSREQVLLLGCADGGLRLIALRDGAHFDTKPTLWTAVNNKASPGITSISVMEEVDMKCICCTAGSDGSIAMFEIHKAIHQSS